MTEFTEKNLKPSPEEHRQQAKMRMAWRMLLVFSIIFLSLLIFLRNEVNSSYSYGGALLFAGFAAIHLYYKKNPDFLFTIGAYAGSILAQLSSWFVIDASHYANFVWISICSMIAYIGISKLSANILLIINLIGVGYFIYFVRNEHVQELLILNTRELTSIYLELLLSFGLLGYFMYHFISFQKMWESAYTKINQSLKKQNHTNEKQNQENIILLKEIHHRVKNNLQIVISLLRLQQNDQTNEESKVQFQEAINRIMVMSSIHQKLYQQSTLSEIDLQNYLKELIDDLKRFYENKKSLEISLNCKRVAVNLKTVVPIGLLINELISNSVKYAFKDKHSGHISVELQNREDLIILQYGDNGSWKENGGNDGFGMELIDIFTDQLNGHKKLVKNERGTTYHFHLKKAE
jgi:two-component sensor histidine kinase